MVWDSLLISFSGVHLCCWFIVGCYWPFESRSGILLWMCKYQVQNTFLEWSDVHCRNCTCTEQPLSWQAEMNPVAYVGNPRLGTALSLLRTTDEIERRMGEVCDKQRFLNSIHFHQFDVSEKLPCQVIFLFLSGADWALAWVNVPITVNVWPLFYSHPQWNSTVLLNYSIKML